jgi:hypothetical protein
MEATSRRADVPGMTTIENFDTPQLGVSWG